MLRTTIVVDERHAPEECRSIAHVRAGVDALDRAIVLLLYERQKYMDAAVPLQAGRHAVGDQERIKAVFANVETAARACGLLEPTARAVWTALIDRAIAYESAAWDARGG